MMTVRRSLELFGFDAVHSDMLNFTVVLIKELNDAIQNESLPNFGSVGLRGGHLRQKSDIREAR